MKQATYIAKEDLENLQIDENGNFIIPEGIKIFIKEDEKMVTLNRIADLEKQLERMQEPTDAELIAEGRMMHPFTLIEI